MCGRSQTDVLMAIVRAMPTSNKSEQVIKQLEEKKDHPALQSTVWIATMGKAGTNMTLALVSMILFKGDVKTLYAMDDNEEQGAFHTVLCNAG